MTSSKSRFKGNKAHYIVFFIVLLCGIATSLTIYLGERKHAYSNQKASGAYFTEKLNDGLTQHITELSSVVALIESGKGEVSSGHFSRFVRSLSIASGISFYFAQYVPVNKRYEYEVQQSVLLGRINFAIYPEEERKKYMSLALGYPDKFIYQYNILYPQYRDINTIIQPRNASALILSEPILPLFSDAVSNSIANTFVLSAPIYLPADARSHKLTNSIVFHGVASAYFSIGSLLNQVTPLAGHDLYYRLADMSSNDPIWFVDSVDDSLWNDGEFDTFYLSAAGRKWRIDTRYIASISSRINWLLVTIPLFVFSLLALILSFYTRKLFLTYCSALDSVNKRIEIDDLTGLLSRYQIQRVLDELIVTCQKDNTQLAALILDLDHFKTINDAFGHEVGDKLISKVSKRLTSVLPESAIAGYLGGDAFLVLLLHNDDQDIPQLNTLAKELIRKISQSYFVDGLTLDIGCSIGVALYPEFGLDGVTLIKNADMAVYRAKTSGRATYHFYDGEMGRRFARNVRIETRLRQALQKESLELHFQPKVDLITERCVGMEALLRWNDEELGVVSPAEFVPIAEQTGIILLLGDWVFEQAFRHILEWQEQGITVPPIAINCSAAQLKRIDFLPKLLALLNKYKIDPSLLEIEVTESILIEDAESCAELLRQISHLGMKLAIDDFGTGYSSLSYLKDLPFHYVKIDQVFIRNIIEDKRHAALTHGIISLSHDLNLKVIAEGITNIDQLHMLKKFGCDVGQGYLFSKALGANTMGSDPMIVALNERESLD